MLKATQAVLNATSNVAVTTCKLSDKSINLLSDWLDEVAEDHAKERKVVVIEHDEKLGDRLIAVKKRLDKRTPEEKVYVSSILD